MLVQGKRHASTETVEQHRVLLSPIHLSQNNSRQKSKHFRIRMTMTKATAFVFDTVTQHKIQENSHYLAHSLAANHRHSSAKDISVLHPFTPNSPLLPGHGYSCSKALQGIAQVQWSNMSAPHKNGLGPWYSWNIIFMYLLLCNYQNVSSKLHGRISNNF